MPTPDFVQRKCTTCDEDDRRVQRQADGTTNSSSTQTSGGGEAIVSQSVAHRISASRGGGSGLPQPTKSFMESRFGEDFSAVKVHTGPEASQLSRALGANAFTVGSDIFFGANKFEQHTHSGQHLLAHELTHTLQQTGGSSVQRKTITDTEPMIMRDSAKTVGTAPTTGDNVITFGATTADGGFGSKVTVSRLTKTVTGGSQPTVTNSKWDILRQRKNVKDSGGAKAAGGTTYYVRGHLLNGVLGGTGADWQNLTPLTQNANNWGEESHLRAFEVPVKTAVLDQGQAVDFSVEAKYEQRPALESQITARSQAVPANDPQLAVMKAERAVPTKLECTAVNSDTKASIVANPVIIDNAIDTDPASYFLSTNASSVVAQQNDALKADLAEYPISVAGKTLVLYVSKSKPKSSVDQILESPVAENQMVANAVAGLTLVRLDRSKSVHHIIARFDPANGGPPVTTSSPVEITLDVVSGTLKLSASKLSVPIDYPYLSPGKFTKFMLEPDGLAGEGMIHPSIPLFGDLTVAFGPSRLVVTKGLGLAGKKSPIPNFRITKDELALELAPEFKPSGTIEFAVGPEATPYATGSVTATAENNEFVAKGTLHANIPGLSAADGEVKYSKSGGWTGSITIATSSIPNTQDVHATVSIGPNGLAAEGGLTIVLPGDGNTVSMSLVYKDQKFVLAGSGQLKIPVSGVDPVQLSFEHDGTHLKGTGKTGITINGLKGTISITYNDGKISGQGTITFEKGKAAGSLSVKLSEENKLSGEGSMTYQITDNLQAKAGIILKEDKSVRVKGALEVTKPIELFAARAGQQTLLHIPTIKIPIPGASIGPVGLVITIDGGIEIHYSVGPGQLRNTKIEAAFNPLEDKPDLDVVIGTQLYVGARAGIGGSIRGALAIDAWVASVSGGLTLGAQADLSGSASADLQLHYTKNHIEFDAVGRINAGLILGLSIDGDVTATALTKEWKKVWRLAGYQYDTGLQFGMEAPLHYASDKPFRPPSVSDIKWTIPKLDPATILKDAIEKAGG